MQPTSPNSINNNVNNYEIKVDSDQPSFVIFNGQKYKVVISGSDSNTVNPQDWEKVVRNVTKIVNRNTSVLAEAQVTDLSQVKIKSNKIRAKNIQKVEKNFSNTDEQGRKDLKSIGKIREIVNKGLISPSLLSGPSQLASSTRSAEPTMVELSPQEIHEESSEDLNALQPPIVELPPEDVSNGPSRPSTGMEFVDNDDDDDAIFNLPPIQTRARENTNLLEGEQTEEELVIHEPQIEDQDQGDGNTEERRVDLNQEALANLLEDSIIANDSQESSESNSNIAGNDEEYVEVDNESDKQKNASESEGIEHSEYTTYDATEEGTNTDTSTESIEIEEVEDNPPQENTSVGEKAPSRMTRMLGGLKNIFSFGKKDSKKIAEEEKEQSQIADRLSQPLIQEEPTITFVRVEDETVIPSATESAGNAKAPSRLMYTPAPPSVNQAMKSKEIKAKISEPLKNLSNLLGGNIRRIKNEKNEQEEADYNYRLNYMMALQEALNKILVKKINKTDFDKNMGIIQKAIDEQDKRIIKYIPKQKLKNISTNLKILGKNLGYLK